MPQEEHPGRGPDRRGDLDATTAASMAAQPMACRVERRPGLTVLAHPDPSRVGDRALAVGLDRDLGLAVSRVAPNFLAAEDTALRPLTDRHLSRQPVFFVRRSATLTIVPGSQAFTVDGQEASGPIEVSEERLRQGVVLVLANCVALLLHEMTVPPPNPIPGLGLVGVSDGIVELGREVCRVRDLKVPVLLRGETGTGKELVARAIHDTGARASTPFVAVNMAALPSSIAAAELFGAVRGAFTGADRARPGLFRDARGGTLFLDEIGEMSAEVQVLLLRFLEDHEVRSLGATRSEKVDVRVIAATDSDLESKATAADFSRPLLERFGGYRVVLSALRQRRDDLGLLFLHFLRTELETLGRPALLSDPGPGRLPWLPAELYVYLARHAWPGNVRELKNIARRIAIRYHELDSVPVEEVAELLAEPRAGDEPAPKQPKRASRQSYREPMEVTESELIDTLRACRWEPAKAAEALGISRPSLYKRIKRIPSIRTASELSGDEIERAHRDCSGVLEEMVDQLEVSKTALKARLRELGLA